MENKIEGRNAVLEALRAGKPIDKLYVLDGCPDGPVRTIIREAKKGDTIINYVKKERLDQLSETGHHQGVIAMLRTSMLQWKIFWKKPGKKGKLPLFSYWIISKIRIIWEL